MSEEAEYVSWLRQQLDEDEAVAQTAADLQDDPEHGWGVQPRMQPDGSIGRGWTVTPHIGMVFEDESAAFIRRFHPAHALADIEAKRRIVFLWQDPKKAERPDGHDGRDPDEVIRDYDMAVMIDEVVRTLVEAYAARPGYKKEWGIY